LRAADLADFFAGAFRAAAFRGAALRAGARRFAGFFEREVERLALRAMSIPPQFVHPQFQSLADQYDALSGAGEAIRRRDEAVRLSYCRSEFVMPLGRPATLDGFNSKGLAS